MVNMIDKRWLAGFIDGEGTIGLRRRKDARLRKGYGIDPYVSITNTNLNVLKEIQKTFGGSIGVTHDKIGNHRKVYRLRILSHEDILKILEDIKPHLLLKSRLSELVINYCRLRRNHTKNDGYTEEEEQIADEVIILNKRGKNVVSRRVKED